MPIAASRRSPRISSTATAEPGSKGARPAEAGAVPPGTAVRPNGPKSRLASGSSAGWSPAHETGSASGVGAPLKPRVVWVCPRAGVSSGAEDASDEKVPLPELGLVLVDDAPHMQAL